MINCKKILISCLILAFFLALCTSFTGCNSDDIPISSSDNAAKIIGEGETSFPFSVVHSDGKEALYEIHTNEKFVGKTLQNLGLISGDMGQYGLYVKTVDGETAEFDKGGKYWAFYINDEYASQGVDQTEIKKGEAYSFKVE